MDSGGVLGSLMGRKLITTAGRKQVIGRPILYKTTKDFLLRFGLKDIAELPSIEEFEKLAGELGEQEEIAMEREQREGGAEERLTGETLEEEMSAAGEATEPQADGDSDDLDAESGEQDQKRGAPMATETRAVPNDPQDNEPDVVGTPEGDNELRPD